MFLIRLHYTQPIEVIDQFLLAHREFLEEGYQKDYFVVSGPTNPRTGGVIISQLKDRAKLEALMENDPFKVNNVANYEIVEFMPVKFHRDFKSFVK